MDTHKFDFKVVFNRSKSVNYARVVSLAKKFSGFKNNTDESEPHEIVINCEELFEKYSTLEKLFNIIRSWKGTFISLNGEEVEYLDIIRKLNGLNMCNKRYLSARHKESYVCGGLGDETKSWGCRLLDGISLNLDTYTYYGEGRSKWYEFGSFSSDDVWKVDKIAIRKSLLAEVEEKLVFLCPAFTKEKLEKVIESLPNEINLKDNKHWEIEYEEDVYGQGIGLKAVGIKYKDEEYTNRYGININLGGINEDEHEEEKSRNIPEINYKDIGGIREIIQSIREVIELPLKRPEILTHLGIRPHKGILLFGPPGNGKTLVAKAIANEVQAHFIIINGPELINKYVGQSEENLRKVFDEARKKSPSIIYFDEIDSLALQRDGGENSKHMAGFINQLLTLMDGMNSNDKVVVIASTNRAELLDKALIRAGRFDYKILIPNPDAEGIKEIFDITSSKMPLDKDINKLELYNEMVGFSGADITFVCKEAGYNALRRVIDLKKAIDSTDKIENYQDIKIEQEDFKSAIKKVIQEKQDVNGVQN